MAKRIYLSGKRGAGLYALVDNADYSYLSQFSWHLKRTHGNDYARRQVYENSKFRTIYMHREILNITDGRQVDHRNGNGLDNQRRNLRACSHKQNQRNHKPAGGSSKYIGVYWKKDECKWKARIKVDGKEIHLGLFSSEVEAAQKRDEAALRYHGEFARLNFPR